MTPDDAKTKWCPFVRFAIGPQTPTWQEAAFSNRGQMDGKCTCVGPDCMAWRIDREYSGDCGGYCGLAGKDGAP